jgi:hypothetical protein
MLSSKEGVISAEGGLAPLAESRFELVSRGWADLKYNTDVLKNHEM